ncbi:MAG: hypothetical protein A3B44_00570 [Candidatus Levybacteria bacterium RIFCSPLOWO2_01_FULL_38_21]|nr:MAG: hypothetical protein A3B44_00570 [Candidatus Levybacteria bacterium RIFCSPLOWO2_01_FULL_38_21]
MSSSSDTFFTSVGCIDGRVQKPIADFGWKKFGAKYPDTITEAGLVGLFSKDHPDKYLIDSLANKIKISLEKHKSKNIVVSGHEDCAGNPVSEEIHKKDIRKTSDLMSLIFPKVSVFPVYIKKINGEWIVEEL